MKTFYKILGLSLSAVLLFASCTKETTPYSPGQPAGNQNVYFSDENDDTVILDLSAEGFSIFLCREDTGSSLTVPITVWCDTPGIISVPESVTFDAGNNIAVLNVKVSNMDPFTEYQMNISLPEEYTQPYKEGIEGYPQCGFVFYKEDYKTYAKGTVYDDAWWTTEDGWMSDCTLEYSEMLDQYRIPNYMKGGTSFVFGWDGDQTFTSVLDKQSGGFTYSSYGTVSGTLLPDYCYFEDDALYLVIKWTVSAGSFGGYYYVFYIDSYAN